MTRKINSSSVYTPIEPLSGRGDIEGYVHLSHRTCTRFFFMCGEQGSCHVWKWWAARNDHEGYRLTITLLCVRGFFPFHEDPNKRVHRPHPFHTESREAKNHLLAAEPPVHEPRRSSHNHPHRPRITKPSASEPQGVIPKMSREPTPTQARSMTPVTSYVPSGLHDAHLPMGKYYPSNYEAKQRRSNQSTPNASRPSSAAGPSSMKTETAVPQITRTDSSHSRSNSDAKRRLQQYQRDMVAQATQAARQIASGPGSSAHLAAAHGVSVQKFQLGSHRPISPRLQPLGSPGPVTPMELEGHGGEAGYLGRGRPVPSPDAGREDDAIARAMAAEAARMRREGRASPAVEAGGFGF